MRRLRCSALGAALLCLGALGSASRAQEAAVAQPGTKAQSDDEVVVTGRRLQTLRKDVGVAQEDLYKAFNANNSDHELDIHCREELPTGSRIPRRVCRPAFVDTATSRGGRELVSTIIHECRGAPICPMQDASANIAGAAAQESLGNLRYMAKRLDNEMRRLIRENPEVAKAAAKYQAKEKAYEEAAGRHDR